MNPIYEYIAAVFIMTLVVGYSLYSLNTMSSSQLSIVNEEQLQTVTERLFDKILLTTGNPENWGYEINITGMSDFGLSSQSGDMYQLDLNKVTKLANPTGITNPLFIAPTTMGYLTGIYDNVSWNYGFSLMVKSALNINITNGPIDPILQQPTNFTIDVTNYQGKYVGNAEVSAIYLWIHNETLKQGKVIIENRTVIHFQGNDTTNWQGRAILNFSKDLYDYYNSWRIPSGYKSDFNITVLLVTVNYYGIQSFQIEVIDKTIPPITLIVTGEYLIANYNDIGPGRGARELKDLTVLEFTSDLDLIVNPSTNETGQGMADKVVNPGAKNYQVYHLTNPITDDIIFAAITVYRGNQPTLGICYTQGATLAINYTSHGYTHAGINSETISRLVRIGHNTFYAELTVWRMSE